MSHLIAVAFLVFATAVQQPAAPPQNRGAQPQRGQRATPVKPPTPLTLRQVIEALFSTRNSTRVEDQISKAGVQFQATPAIVDILKQFGASPKLISMIPVPPPPPELPAPKLAGPLTVVCEPKDCAVAVDDRYAGSTTQNRKTVSGLHPGEVSIDVFADGYEHLNRRIQLQEGKPAEEKFSFKRSPELRAQIASAALLKAVTSLGGTDGLAEFADVEGTGSMQWTNNSGKVEQWMLSFNKRIGRDIVATFKTKDGQCTASVLAQAAKQECRGGLRGGEKIAEQGTSLLLSYQLQDVIHTLMKRPLIASETDDNRLESPDTKDAYVMTIGNDGLPTDLVYRIGETDAPIHVEYSNYMNVNKGKYPGRIAIGRLNSAPVWVFTLIGVQSKVLRSGR